MTYDGQVPPAGNPSSQHRPITYRPLPPIGPKRGPWAVWWLAAITFGIYYLVWFQAINRELTTFNAEKPNASCSWWSQLIPIYGLVALAKTAGRVNRAACVVPVQMQISGFMAWFSMFWFASQTRYLQRRVNRIWDAAYATGQL